LASGEAASVVEGTEEDGPEGQGPEKEASTAQQGDADESGRRAIPAVELCNSRSKRVIRRLGDGCFPLYILVLDMYI
jgi:hypothetical protein